MPLIPDQDFIETLIEERASEDRGRDFYQSHRLFRATFAEAVAPALEFGMDRERVKQARRGFKSYSRHRQVPLERETGILGRVTLDEVLRSRRSHRRWEKEARLSFSEISGLFENSVGLLADGRRSYPSPGGLYAHEVYLALWGGEGLEAGLWHYNVEKHAMELVRSGDPREWLPKFYFGEQGEEAGASGVIFLTCVFDRLIQKYGQRGWRFLHYETGVIIENFYLVATALGLGVCVKGNVLEDDLCPYLGIDGVSEGFMTSMVLGRPVASRVPAWRRWLRWFR